MQEVEEQCSMGEHATVVRWHMQAAQRVAVVKVLDDKSLDQNLNDSPHEFQTREKE